MASTCLGTSVLELAVQASVAGTENSPGATTVVGAVLASPYGSWLMVRLCVAVMGQVTPSPSAFNATVVQVTTDQSSVEEGGPISAAARLGTLNVHLHLGLRVRDQVTMADMSLQKGDLQPRAGGWYRGTVVPPMEGYMNLAIQVQPSALRVVAGTLSLVDVAQP